jgi:hypothetical protein
MDDHLRRNLFSAVLYMQSKIKIGKAVINTLQLATRKNYVQLVSKKSGNENFPDVNLVLSICQLIVYLTIPIK